MENDPGVRPIVSAEQIPPALLSELHALLLAANQAHDLNRTEVAVEEIDIFFRLVFAIRIMDYDVEHLDNYWNEDLAIHLFQKILYDHT